jgi:hypothetical protein
MKDALRFLRTNPWRKVYYTGTGNGNCAAITIVAPSAM